MKIVLLTFMALLVVGCGASESDDRRDETVGAEITSGYNQQMQRAQDVQLELETSKRDLDAAIESSDQGRRNP
jgi:hypothetical protein